MKNYNKLITNVYQSFLVLAVAFGFAVVPFASSLFATTPVANASSHQTLFTDDFSSGDFTNGTSTQDTNTFWYSNDSGWGVVTGGDGFIDSSFARLSGDVNDNSLTLKVSDPNAYKDFSVIFRYKNDKMESDDSIQLQYSTSTDGQNYNDFANSNATYGDNETEKWEGITAALPSAVDEPSKLYIRWEGSLDATTSDQFDLDYVTLRAEPTSDVDTCDGDDFGNDDNSRPVENTDTGELFSAIQDAIDDCDTQSGHTIVAEDQTYSESVDVNKSQITVKAADYSNKPKIRYGPSDSTGQPAVKMSAASTTLSGFKVTRSAAGRPSSFSNGTKDFTQGVRISASGVTVEDNNVEGDDLDDENNKGIMVLDDSDVSNVVIDSNEVSGFHGGISVTANKGNKIDGVDITGNTVDGNDRDGLNAATINGDVKDITWKNNTIKNSKYGLYVYGDEDENVPNDISGGTFTVENNNFENNTTQVKDNSEVLNMTSVRDTNTFGNAVFIDRPGSSLVYTVWSSIQDAVDTAQDGDTIEVLPGTIAYDENVTVDKSLTLEGANAGTPGDGNRGSESQIDGMVEIASDGVELDGFKVTPGEFTQKPAAGIFVSGSNAEVKNNIVSDVRGDGVDQSGNSLSIHGIQVFKQNAPRIENVTVSNNLIEAIDNGGSSEWPYGGGVGVKVQNQLDEAAVRSNTIKNIHSAGWTYGVVSTPSSQNTAQPKNITIEKNTITSVGNGDEYNVNDDPDSAPYPGVAVGLDTDSGNAESGSTADAGELTVN